MIVILAAVAGVDIAAIHISCSSNGPLRVSSNMDFRASFACDMCSQGMLSILTPLLELSVVSPHLSKALEEQLVLDQLFFRFHIEGAL